MTVNFNGVIRMMAALLLVLGICMFPSLLVALIYHEEAAAAGFLLTLVPSFILGYVLMKLFPLL